MEKYLVQIRVLGTMTQEGEKDEVETLSDGLLFKDGDKIELRYKEIAENEDGEVKVKILFTESRREDGTECRILKDGPVKSDMLFLKDEQTQCLYVTPFGEVVLEVYTYSVQMAEEDGNLKAELLYRLLSRGMPISEAKVSILAKRKACP